MKPVKFLDKMQITLIVCFGVFEIFKNVFLFQELSYMEANPDVTELPLNIAIPYSIFSLLSIACVAWIIVRFVTYKKRKEEYLQNNF